MTIFFKWIRAVFLLLLLIGVTITSVAVNADQGSNRMAMTPIPVIYETA